MKITVLFLILTFVTIFLACEDLIVNDETIIDDGEEIIYDFCEEVNNLNFSGVENKIEYFLDSVVVNHIEPDEFFESEISELKIWLEEKDCISEIIIWPGIIETNPPIKELPITFIKADSTFIKVLDIELDLNLDVRFHGN